MDKENNKSKKHSFMFLCYFFSILILVIGMMYYIYISFFVNEKHLQKLNEFERQMKIVEKQKEFLSNAAIGMQYDNFIKNKFGFWEDKHGFIYDIEFNGDSGIDVVTWLGKLSPTEQQALQKEKQAKLEKIEYHKKELENLGVEIKKKNSGAVGMPMYDGGAVKQTVNSMKKILNSAESRNKRNEN